jgi:YD repeat-containing protein
LILLAGLGIFRIGIVFADYNTPVQTTTYQDIAKMGTTTQYGYIGPSAERLPSFHSALIAKSTQGWWVQSQRIEVSGNDPNGNPLSGDRFAATTVLASPDGSSAEQQILVVIANTLLSLIPYGLGEPVKCTMSAGGAVVGWSEQIAWGQWDAPTYSYPSERGLEFGFLLEVYTTVEGTYTINIHYHTLIEILAFIPGLPFLIPMFRALDLYDTLQYTYVNTPLTPSTTPSGPTSGYTYATYTYSISTTDPNGDSLRYQFDWG